MSEQQMGGILKRQICLQRKEQCCGEQGSLKSWLDMKELTYLEEESHNLNKKYLS